MQPEIKTLLFDMQHAASGIALFTSGKTREEFTTDLMLQRAVERQFEIIGEALTRLRRIDPQFVEQVSEYHKIIGLRNILIHGYDIVDPSILWNIIQHKLPILREEVDRLIQQ